MFKVLSQNLLTITFITKVDNSKILDGKPWLFNNYLLALRELDRSLQPKLVPSDYKTFWV